MDAHQAPAWAAALEASGLGAVARDSLFLYPVASILHVLGIGLLLGAIIAFDLRVLGAARAVPIDAAARLLLPIARTGFALIVVSGVPMLAADATHLAVNPAARIKAGLIALALVNVAAFHRLAWPEPGTEPAGLARAFAAVSAVGWLCVAAAGRAIAYF